MNCLLYDHAVLHVRVLDVAHPLGQHGQVKETMSSTVFGPTCDGLDVVLRDYPLPKLDNGNWLVFPRMGAYTLCGAANFNGIHACNPNIFYVESGS
jgi:ornithine decarboxylase